MQTLQEHIIAKLGVKSTINPEEEIQTRVDFLKEFLQHSGQKGFVLGISGGQDSALAGRLAQIAVDQLNAQRLGIQWTPTLWKQDIMWRRDVPDKEYEERNHYKLFSLLLPYGQQKDMADALEVTEEFIQPYSFQIVNIKPTVDTFAADFNLYNPADNTSQTLSDYHKGNVKARVRMLTQYAFAGQLGYLVLGTDHAAENSGFFTKFGDGGADLLPLAGLNKRQGKELLKALNAPEFLFTKVPTADLLDEKPQQADEFELGITYDEIDDYLEGKEISPDAAIKYESFFLKNEHKRQLPATMTDTWWK